MIQDVATSAFAASTAVVIAFQLALAAGAPWGAYTMGGSFPGRYPPPMRVAAVGMALVLALMVAVVLSRADLALPAWSRVAGWMIWGIVGFTVLGTVMNAITPSVKERVWAPVTAVLAACSLVVALAAGA